MDLRRYLQLNATAWAAAAAVMIEPYFVHNQGFGCHANRVGSEQQAGGQRGCRDDLGSPDLLRCFKSSLVDADNFDRKPSDTNMPLQCLHCSHR